MLWGLERSCPQECGREIFNAVFSLARRNDTIPPDGLWYQYSTTKVLALPCGGLMIVTLMGGDNLIVKGKFDEPIQEFRNG